MRLGEHIANSVSLPEAQEANPIPNNRAPTLWKAATI